MGGVCFCAPTRVHEKFVRFHISAHGYTKNAPHFTLPNKDSPKTHPVLHPNRRRGAFRGVCNTPLHGYVQNLAGFIFPHTDAPKTRPVSYFPIRIHQKPTRFHITPSGYTQNAPGFRPKPPPQDISGRMLLRPYTGMCIIHPVSYSPTRIRQKRTRFHLSQ